MKSPLVRSDGRGIFRSSRDVPAQDEAATGGSKGDAVAGEEECGGPPREEVAAIGRGTARCGGGPAGEPAAEAGGGAGAHPLHQQEPDEPDGAGAGLVGPGRTDADPNPSAD